MPLYPPASASSPGTINWSGYYPGSSTNYWSLTSASFADFLTNGTIPTPTVISNSGFGTVSKATSSLPGMNFSAPRTGILRISITPSVIGSNSTTGAQTWALQFLESTGPSNIAFTSGNSTGVAVAQNTQFPVTLVAYFTTTISTTYNFKLQGAAQAGTMFIGGTANAGALLSIAMEYIT